MTRNSSIDIIKFVFAIVIALYHFSYVFIGGYILVEGFFMISGYLMMASLCKAKESDLNLSESTAKFTLRKYSSIFFPLLYSAIIGFLVREILIDKRGFHAILSRIPLLLFEVFPLQIAGFEGFWATGVSWYLSAMLISVMILHGLAKKNPRKFGWSVAPLIVVLGYGLICHQVGHISVPNTWDTVLGMVNYGLVRGIAGMSAGFVLYLLVEKSQKQISIPMRSVYTVIYLIGWTCVIMAMTWIQEGEGFVHRYILNYWDFILIAVIFGILYLTFSSKTLFALLGNHKFTGIFATASTYVYLNHHFWSGYLRTKYAATTEESLKALLPKYIALVAVTSVAVWGLSTLSTLAVKKIKERSIKSQKTEVAE